MARSIDTINQQILDAKNAQPLLAGLNSTSKVSIWGLVIYIVAVAINFLEQIMDLFRIEMQGIADKAAPGSVRWVQWQVLKFQYSATNAQFLVLNTVDFTINYAPVNLALQIITQCSVATDINKVVNIKVAKQNPPVALVFAETSALTEYLNEKGFAGVQYSVTSASGDFFYIQADIFVDGQYTTTAKANIITALNNFMATLPFDGYVKVSSIETTILNVNGVKDVVIKSLAVRPNASSFGGGAALVTASTVILRTTTTFSGYLIAESTTGNGFLDGTNLNIIQA